MSPRNLRQPFNILFHLQAGINSELPACGKQWFSTRRGNLCQDAPAVGMLVMMYSLWVQTSVMRWTGKEKSNSSIKKFFFSLALIRASWFFLFLFYLSPKPAISVHNLRSSFLKILSPSQFSILTFFTLYKIYPFLIAGSSALQGLLIQPLQMDRLSCSTYRLMCLLALSKVCVVPAAGSTP